MESDTLQHILTDLTAHQKWMLRVLFEAHGAWLTRSNIANFMERKQLTPYDKSCLQNLYERGLIDIATRPSRVPNVDFAYIYRMLSEVAQSLENWLYLDDEN